jgi:HlyD family secretion protein
MDSQLNRLDALRIDRTAAPIPSSSGRWWFVLLLLGTAAAAAWWFLHKRPLSVQTAAVQVAKPKTNSSGKALLNASGYIVARVEATVSSKITGKVTETLVEEGMKVEKNAIVAKLDSLNAESGLRIATAQRDSAQLSLAETQPMLHFAESESQRYTELAASKAVNKSEVVRAEMEAKVQAAKLERLRAELTVANRQVEDWQQQVDDTIIRAPFSGVVTTKDSQPGEMISPMSSGGSTRTGICTLVDMASLEIEVDVGESFINRVKAAQAIEATLDAYPDWKIPGKVIAIIPTADRQKATVRVRVGFDKLDPRMLPQMGVKVAFLSDPASPDSPARPDFTIPAEALQKADGKDIVWTVRDGKAERRAVTVSQMSPTEILLAAGVAAGEKVILNPPTTLTDGAEVSVPLH